MVATRLAVRTRYGVVLGASRHESFVFSGVPYAADAVGPLRFAPPAPPQRWNGVRPPEGQRTPLPGAAPLAACADYFLGGALENRLTLRISTPTLEPAALPVIVWFHGEGLVEGSAYAAANNGHGFARDGVVHVAVDSRLGLEGYFPFSGAEEAGALNLGLQDQIAALKWLHEEIGRFGGDPNRITIGGYGSGGTSVSYLLSSELARGLFSRAVLISASPRLVHSPEIGRRLRDRVAALLGARPTAERLRQLDRHGVERIEEMLQTHVRSDPETWGWHSVLGAPFAAVTGTETLPAAPLDVLAAGGTASVPMLIGCASHELGAFLRESEHRRTMRSTAHLFPDARIDEALVAAYEQLGYRGPEDESLFTALTTDYLFRLPALQYAQQHRAPTWLYQFDWRNPALEPGEGSVAGVDIPLWNDDLDRAREFPELTEVYGAEPPHHLVDPMHGGLVRFVHGESPGWRPYDLEERMTMCFDDIAVPVPDLHGVTREAWRRALVSAR